MSGLFKASAALGDTASGRQTARNEQKSSWGSFWKTAALLKGEVVIFYLSLKMWLDHIIMRCLWNLLVEASIILTPTTPVPLNSSFNFGLSPTKGSTLQWCTKQRACAFPCKSRKCIDGSHFFSCIFLCMSKRQFRLPVYSVLRSFKAA